MKSIGERKVLKDLLIVAMAGVIGTAVMRGLFKSSFFIRDKKVDERKIADIEGAERHLYTPAT